MCGEGPCQRPLERAVAKPRMSGQLGKFRGRSMLVWGSEGAPSLLCPSTDTARSSMSQHKFYFAALQRKYN